MATLTENINYLQPTGFKLIMDRKHFPNLTFFATSVSHPSISLSATNISFRRADIKIAGDKLTFGELQCNIIMDEDMTAYQEMYDWMKALVETSETSPRDRSDTVRPSSADISLIALTSNNNQVKNIRYIDAVPTALGDVSFETVGGDNYITFPVTFAFSYFELV